MLGPRPPTPEAEARLREYDTIDTAWGLGFAVIALLAFGRPMGTDRTRCGHLLAKGTGKPLTERHLTSSRPGYADYLARTSGFFLPPPKGNR